MPTKKTTPKNLKKSFAAETDVQVLAHAGSKEAIERLEEIIKTENDPDKRLDAQMALDECELFYYSPNNKKEDEEYLLSYMIWRNENRIIELETEKESYAEKLKRFDLEKKVHENVLSNHKNKREDWKYRVMDDFVSYEKNKIDEIVDNIEYEKAWIAEAKKMITTERYKSGIPGRHLAHMNFDGFDNEDCDCGCCDNDSELKIEDIPF